MDRKLEVIIDKKTWPKKGVPKFPSSFSSSSSPYDLDIPAMLMMIGYLTTPTSSTGVSLSEFWAWVRYLAAISADNTLSLTRSFAELDAHQKTILSDDFGMGVPLLWLSEKLSLVEIVDGRYFMQRIASSIGATQRRTAKRGPNKTPDFVARDTAGKWHVIECKGTQSGAVFSQKQLGSKGPPPTGGVAQKCSIIFPHGHTGQRLVCGLSIDVEGGTGSVLKIVDPEPDDPFEVGSDQIEFAEDAMTRGVMSKALRMAGFEVTAETVASPFGPRPDARRPSPRASNARSYLQARVERSRGEFLDKHQDVFDGKFRGREVVIELPRAIFVNGSSVKKVIIKQGVNRDALEELQERPAIEEFDNVSQTSWAGLIRKNKISMKTDELNAVMSIGNAFRSELILQKE
jgi:hypothetical protein